MFKTLQDAVLRLESVLRFKPKASLDFLKKALEFSGIKTDSYKKYTLLEQMVRALQAHF